MKTSRFSPSTSEEDELFEMRRIQADHNRRVRAWFQRRHIDSHSLEPPPDDDEDPFPKEPDF